VKNAPPLLPSNRVAMLMRVSIVISISCVCGYVVGNISIYFIFITSSRQSRLMLIGE
jgi:hypothetical protein